MRFGISIFLLFVHYCLLAQLVSPDAVSTRYTSYPSAPGTRDQIFIYCNSSGSQKGSLSARIPENKAPSDFAWYRWNTSASSFSIAVKTETAVRSSSLANLDPGGYRVIISGGHDTIMTAWIVFDETPFVSAKLMNPMKHCNYVALDGTAGAAVSSFGYFDPLDGRALSLKNEVSFLWSSEPESSIPYPSLELDPKIFTPPLVDVVYTLRVNTLGCSSSDTIDYKSIHVKADFTLDPLKGEAPLEVAITDKSVRAHVYEWDFGDDTISTLNDPLIHTYYKPGEYTIRLRVESERHCIDSVRSAKIIVEPSALAIPNVFSPDGDGYNDRFMVDSRSLRYLTMDVFSRSGRKVYSFSGEGERLKEWTGWDGNINNSSVKAAPGLYFYIIRAYGWDDIRYDSKEYRGFVYLYR